MIRRIEGAVVGRGKGAVIVSCSGIGFAVNVVDAYPARETGERVSLWIHLRLREDDVSLYGFETEDELALFESMQKIHGISAKKALAVLSHLGADGIRRAIVKGEVKDFTQVPGIGKKLAQQFLLDMKGAIDLSEVDAARGHATKDDAVLALIELGFNEVEAEERVSRARAGVPKGGSTSEIVRMALKS